MVHEADAGKRETHQASAAPRVAGVGPSLLVRQPKPDTDDSIDFPADSGKEKAKRTIQEGGQVLITEGIIPKGQPPFLLFRTVCLGFSLSRTPRPIARNKLGLDEEKAREWASHAGKTPKLGTIPGPLFVTKQCRPLRRPGQAKNGSQKRWLRIVFRPASLPRCRWRRTHFLKKQPKLAVWSAWAIAATGVESSLARVCTPDRIHSVGFSSAPVKEDSKVKGLPLGDGRNWTNKKPGNPGLF